MPAKEKLPAESETDMSLAISENIAENVKYIKKLKIQRSVLNKIIAEELTPSATNHDDESVNPKIQTNLK